MAFRPLERAKTYLELVKFEHTLFALPFAYAGMSLASEAKSDTPWPGLGTFIWITLAMIGARTAAMSLNRLIDAGIDARNPRTQMRHLPRGAVRTGEAITLAVLSSLLLFVAALQLGPLPTLLMPLAVVFLVIYPYTKRFTWLCHLWLGITIGASAAGGWIAVSGAFAPATWLLWLAVVFWMLGIDIIYATQDIEVDRREGLQSIPARFGLNRALEIARFAHIVMLLLLLLVGLSASTAWPYFLGVVIIGVILTYEHAIVSPNDLTRLNEAFFTANVWISSIMLTATVLEALAA